MRPTREHRQIRFTTVVFTGLPLSAPCQPWRVISRSPVQRATAHRPSCSAQHLIAPRLAGASNGTAAQRLSDQRSPPRRHHRGKDAGEPPRSRRQDTLPELPASLAHPGSTWPSESSMKALVRATFIVELDVNTAFEGQRSSSRRKTKSKQQTAQG